MKKLIQEEPRVVTLRMDKTLFAQVKALAERDSNPLSAIIRRLVMTGLRVEERRDASVGL